eukprot:gene22420-biopygen14776
MARAWRGLQAMFWLGWRGRGAGMARAWCGHDPPPPVFFAPNGCAFAQHAPLPESHRRNLHTVDWRHCAAARFCRSSEKRSCPRPVRVSSFGSYHAAGPRPRPASGPRPLSFLPNSTMNCGAQRGGRSEGRGRKDRNRNANDARGSKSCQQYIALEPHGQEQHKQTDIMSQREPSGASTLANYTNRRIFLSIGPQRHCFPGRLTVLPTQCAPRPPWRSPFFFGTPPPEARGGGKLVGASRTTTGCPHPWQWMWQCMRQAFLWSRTYLTEVQQTRTTVPLWGGLKDGAPLCESNIRWHVISAGWRDEQRRSGGTDGRMGGAGRLQEG